MTAPQRASTPGPGEMRADDVGFYVMTPEGRGRRVVDIGQTLDDAIPTEIVSRWNAHEGLASENARLREALEAFVNSLDNARRSGLSPQRDYSDWATVEWTARAALAVKP